MKIYRNPELTAALAKSNCGCGCGCGNRGCGGCGGCSGCGGACGLCRVCGCCPCRCFGAGESPAGTGCGCGCAGERPANSGCGCGCDCDCGGVGGASDCFGRHCDCRRHCWDDCFDSQGRCKKCYNYCGTGFATQRVLEKICAESSTCRCRSDGLCGRRLSDLCGISPFGERCRECLGPPKGERCGPQIGLVIEGCQNCRVLNAAIPRINPYDPSRTLPIGLPVGNYFLEYSGKSFPFSVVNEGCFFYIKASYNPDIEIIGPTEDIPIIHTIRILV